MEPEIRDVFSRANRPAPNGRKTDPPKADLDPASVTPHIRPADRTARSGGSDTPRPRSARRPLKPRNFPLHQTLPGFLRDPFGELERIGRVADGRILKLDLGVSKPLVVTHPDHVQAVLRNSEQYVRDGVYWRPLQSLTGDGILGEGEQWALSRKVLLPVFTARNITALSERMADTINEAVAEFAESARDGRTVAVAPEMARIVNRTVVKVFFGEKIRPAETDRLMPAFEAVATALAFRFLLPFVPDSVPMPGDRAFRDGLRVMDEIMFGLVRRYRDDPGDGEDIFTALCRARTDEGGELTDRWIRDNLVSMFATGTETTATALTWLWPILDRHPEVLAKLHDEIGRVVGDGPASAEHLKDLTYTKQVVQEVLRLYPVGWIFPRMALRESEIGGVRIKARQTLLISPYLTHRLESVWERPLEFDPDRFAPERVQGRHRYAYFPFGGGPHQCIGQPAFDVEAKLILASILSRYRPVLSPTPTPVGPRIGASVRPNQDLEMTLEPLERT